MTRTETLIAQAQAGDRDASEALVAENTGLIWSVAKRFLGRGTELDDLFQLGCLGFLKAIAAEISLLVHLEAFEFTDDMNTNTVEVRIARVRTDANSSPE